MKFLLSGISLLLISMTSAVQAQEITFTADQVDEGIALYEEFCVECHGDKLDNGRFATPIKGFFFANRWEGRSLGELARFTYEEMPEGNGKYLRIEEYIALIAYILNENGFSAGDTPMSEEFSDLDPINLTF